MFLFKKKADLREFLSQQEANIGFIPTMGALHEGHISLIHKAIADGCVTVCSIFVNPAQFNEKSDYDKYPVTLAADMNLLLASGCDVLFLPSVEEMYPNGKADIPQYEIGHLNDVLEGVFRPGHFNGVCAIVDRLLQTVQPGSIYMGEKDFQQCMVILRLISVNHPKVKMITCATLREANGLAMSSRNQRLSDAGRQKAAAIYQNLEMMRNEWKHTSFTTLQHVVLADLKQKGFETEYLALAEAEHLEPLADFDTEKNMVILVATRLEGVRLIDNIRINDPVQEN